MTTSKASNRNFSRVCTPDVDEESVITYIAEGVGIRHDLKYPLYSERNFKELIKAFELIEA